MELLKKVLDKYTRCDSGLLLNPFLHVFMFITLVCSVAFLFFGHTDSVSESILYQRTDAAGGDYALSIWGIVGAVVIFLHTVAFWVRGKIGVLLMKPTIFGGAYLWFWAGSVYLEGHYWFQFLTYCLPNLCFWAWYAWQHRKRKRGDRVAFV